MTPQYIGEYAVKLDEKGRVSVPKRFRGGAAETSHDIWYLTRGFDQCVAFYSQDAWNLIHSQVSQYSIMNPRALDFRRLFFGSMAEVQVDGQGRITIPSHLREYAGLDKEAVLIGVDDHLELWSKEALEAFQRGYMAEYKETAAALFAGAPVGHRAEETSNED